VTRIILPGQAEEWLAEAVVRFREASCVAALTGAGISVESGIPDFRSPGGVWARYDANEYATLEAFLCNPAKAWRLYRDLARGLVERQPNAAHLALARLEEAGRLEAVITQNIDGLHQAAGSRCVLEMHGDHHHLQCLRCDWRGPLRDEHLETGDKAPGCPLCGYPLKPNMVLFGEDVRHMPEIEALVGRCDLLLVVGTSAQVYPAARIPGLVARHNGLIYEFNLGPTDLTRGRTDFGNLWASPGARSDYLFQGPATETVSLFVDAVLSAGR